jgi:hypothetical protein
MTARLHAPLVIVMVSIFIGLASMIVTMFLGRSAGIIALLIMCGCYSMLGVLTERKPFNTIIILIVAIVISGCAAILFGYVLVRFILRI